MYFGTSEGFSILIAISLSEVKGNLTTLTYGSMVFLHKTASPPFLTLCTCSDSFSSQTIV